MALAGLGTVVLGVVVGIASVAVHVTWWGLPLAVAATLVTAVALPAGWPRLTYALGWIALVAWVMLPRDEGDYVISADLHGYALLGLGVALLMGAVLTLPKRDRPDTRHGSDRGGEST